MPFDDGVRSTDLQQIALVVFFHSVNCRKHSTCTHGGYSLQLAVVVYILKVLANMLHALQLALVVVVMVLAALVHIVSQTCTVQLY